MQVNNVIDPFKYTEVPFGSKSELKEYLKVSGKPLSGCKVLLQGRPACVMDGAECCVLEVGEVMWSQHRDRDRLYRCSWRPGQEYVRSVRAKLKEKGTPQPEIKEFMAQAPGMVK